MVFLEFRSKLTNFLGNLLQDFQCRPWGEGVDIFWNSPLHPGDCTSVSFLAFELETKQASPIMGLVLHFGYIPPKNTSKNDLVSTV